MNASRQSSPHTTESSSGFVLWAVNVVKRVLESELYVERHRNYCIYYIILALIIHTSVKQLVQSSNLMELLCVDCRITSKPPVIRDVDEDKALVTYILVSKQQLIIAAETDL